MLAATTPTSAAARESRQRRQALRRHDLREGLRLGSAVRPSVGPLLRHARLRRSGPTSGGWCSAGITTGCAPGVFCPTRAGHPRADGELPEARHVHAGVGGQTDFVDDSAARTTRPTSTASPQCGITTGCADGQLLPAIPSVTRGQMAELPGPGRSGLPRPRATSSGTTRAARTRTPSTARRRRASRAAAAVARYCPDAARHAASRWRPSCTAPSATDPGARAGAAGRIGSQMTTTTPPPAAAPTAACRTSSGRSRSCPTT